MKNKLILLVPFCLLTGFLFLNASSTPSFDQPVNQSKRLVDDKPQAGKRVVKTDAEWKKTLTPDQYAVLREHGTERAFTSPLNDIHDRGVFYCAACHNPLFSSTTKFNSGTGWPSFYTPIAKNAVKENVDKSYGMVRTEVLCNVCGGHLGHVFDDGPKPTGLRYCMNGVAMTFEKK
ncbi:MULTISPECIES: peptide-methionine (R)-S-oxide reductase MsrB [Spirosoma]|uniref:peptide-methionine (R)-S-oxide reductase n=1 Tax=Spirosoma liriopis TaxID=2937440 RepID=A0ABT0HHJ2_9BACT|nr:MULTISPECIES: peptide-methionine (R)-S-oxide reductase MsrB [Spirosoma]MCK8491060.1 peptide-methionine (R)-S-oxide reductase MsrB [Spirosoma liriopis]UHG90443.1 peptide-methionine (R)-S-oxide reductase MsrB [Spirosoma oryzicola]